MGRPVYIMPCSGEHEEMAAMTARSVRLRLLGRVCQHERYSRVCQRRAALDALSGQRLLALLRE